MTDAARTLEKLLAEQSLCLTEEQVDQLIWLMNELLRWTQRRNLTAITEPLAVVEKHLIDSLSLLPFLPQRGRLLDVGSGAGFPGLPVKIARPALDLVSVDAVAKKIQFQKHVARHLGLTGFTAIHGRIEECAQERGWYGFFDRVTARAVAHLRELMILGADYVRPGGALIAMKGPEGRQEWQECCSELIDAGWEMRLERLSLPVSGAERSLLILTRAHV